MRIREFFMDIETKASQSLSDALEQARARIAAINRTQPHDVIVKQVVPSGATTYTVMVIVKIWENERTGVLV